MAKQKKAYDYHFESGASEMVIIDAAGGQCWITKDSSELMWRMRLTIMLYHKDHKVHNDSTVAGIVSVDEYTL